MKDRERKYREDAIEKSNHVIKELQKNRKKFHEIKSKSQFGKLQPTQSELNLLWKNLIQKEVPEEHRTSWSDLR